MANKQSTFKKAPAKQAGARKIGESDVKSLAGLTFGKRDELPARVQTVDPARLAAADELLTKLQAGETATDGASFKTQHEAYLGGMVYRRLVVLGLTRRPVKGMTPFVRVTQQGTEDFRWTLYAGTPRAKSTPKPVKTAS